MNKAEQEANLPSDIRVCTMWLERSDGINFLGFLANTAKLEKELEYLGINTIGEFYDNFDDITNRIINRYPDFFEVVEDDMLTRDELKTSIEGNTLL